jgi:hypothetical protein
VLGTDSRSTTTKTFQRKGKHVRVGSDTTAKVFDVHGRYAVATHGADQIGEETIAALIEQFEPGEADLASLDAVSNALGEFLHGRASKVEPEVSKPRLGLVVAGPRDDGAIGIREVLVPGPKIKPTELGESLTGTLWRGQDDAITRLMYGVDWRGLHASKTKLPDDVREALEGLTYVQLAPMTLQDAVDFAGLLIHTTTELQRFVDGTVARQGMVAGVGGPPQMVVARRDGVEWIERPGLRPAYRPPSRGRVRSRARS